MPTATCPSAAALTAAVALLGLIGALCSGMIAHGILRPMLEARGVTPWTLRDSLGSTPLVTLGSALKSGAVGLLVLQMTFKAAGALCVWPAWAVAAELLTVAAGALMMRLGLLALRKLL